MTATEAIPLLIALRNLTTETGTITTRSQSKILQSLSDTDMVRVAVELEKRAQMRKAMAPLFGSEVSEARDAR